MINLISRNWVGGDPELQISYFKVEETKEKEKTNGEKEEEK